MFLSSGSITILAVLLYSGAAIGAVLAGDVFSLFLFWEIMAIGSALIIFSANPKHGEV